MSLDPVKINPAISLKPNQMMIAGRIEHVSKFDGKFDHIIVTPASDSYSKPAYTRVSSVQKLGDAGDEVKTVCLFNGWPNNYQNKNNEKVWDVRGFFVAVE